MTIKLLEVEGASFPGCERPAMTLAAFDRDGCRGHIACGANGIWWVYNLWGACIGWSAKRETAARALLESVDNQERHPGVRELVDDAPQEEAPAPESKPPARSKLRAFAPTKAPKKSRKK